MKFRIFTVIIYTTQNIVIIYTPQNTVIVYTPQNIVIVDTPQNIAIGTCFSIRTNMVMHSEVGIFRVNMIILNYFE